MDISIKALDRAALIDILEEIKLRSQEINMVGGSITIYGGAAMLFHQIHGGRMTRDIDAAFGPDKEILQIIKDISEHNKYGLSTDGRWFNNQIVVSDGTLPLRSDVNAIVYSETPNLKIKIASRESLLAMKAVSMFYRNRGKDIEDAQWLITDLEVTSPNEVLEIVKKHWSERQLESRYFDEGQAKHQWSQDIEFFTRKK